MLYVGRASTGPAVARAAALDGRCGADGPFARGTTPPYFWGSARSGPMLHLANGETVAALLRQAGLEGSIMDADDLWMEGPWGATPEDRARELERRFGIPPQEYLARGREALVATMLRAEEAVFWTEEDLFCQANLCEALRHVPPTHAGRLWLAAPERQEERLGHLAPEALARRFDARAPLTDARLRLAHRAADAFASPDPRAVEALLREDLAAWPALRTGLLAHLRRFPSTRNGLDAVEEDALRILAREGPLSFPDLFAALQRIPRFWSLGMGDVQLVALLREVRPLVAVEGDEPARWTLRAADAAAAVLAGEVDALSLRHVDRWVGGVRVRGADPWRWDEAAGALRPPRASPV